MTFYKKVLHAQLFQDALTFSTKAQSEIRQVTSEGYFKSLSAAAAQKSFKNSFVKDFTDDGVIFINIWHLCG